MKKQFSRRDLLKTGIAAGASSIVLPAVAPEGIAAPSAGSAASPGENPSGTRTVSLVQTAAAQPDGAILPLSSTSDVYIPPRGYGLFKFSYDFPESSVAFAGMLFSFRLYTFENAYGLDRDHLTAEKTPDGMTIRCSQFVWAGGQEKVPGTLLARLKKNGDFIEWTVSAEMDRPIKSIAAILRGVPRGKVSPGSGGFFDPKDNELLIGYPFGGGDHHGAISVDSPVAVIQAGDQEFFLLSTILDNQVRANRIYLQPGANGYRAELVYERGGWEKSNRLESPTWRAGRTRTADDAYKAHYSRVARAFHIPTWEERQDVPAWFREVALVVSIHGMHWTGYIFNDFAKALRTLQWVATQIPANRVMVFLPAWDGRYYWDYPIYKVSSRLGGDDGFRTLIQALKLDYLLIDTHPGLNTETLHSIALSSLLLIILRPDQQDYLGTGVTVQVARKLGVPEIVLIVNKVPHAFDPATVQARVEAAYGCDVAAVLPHADEMMILASEGLFALHHPTHPLTAGLRSVVGRIRT